MLILALTPPYFIKAIFTSSLLSGSSRDLVANAILDI